MFVSVFSSWKLYIAIFIIQAMGTNTGHIPLPTEREILERASSQRFVDRSHPADTYILCGTPHCQCWVWTSRLSRACQTCLGCGRTWYESYLQNGYTFWTYVPVAPLWFHWLKIAMKKKHLADLQLHGVCACNIQASFWLKTFSQTWSTMWCMSCYVMSWLVLSHATLAVCFDRFHVFHVSLNCS